MRLEIPVFYAFARSGGTLINRCLGSITGNIILSEVNPLASPKDPVDQAFEWFNLLSEDEFEQVRSWTYIEKIRYLALKSQKSDKCLIIRDWSTVNFLRNIRVFRKDTLFPSKVLEQATYLARYGFEAKPVAIVRRSTDVYASLKKTFNYLQDLDVQEFGDTYLRYAEFVSSYPIFHYEDFCEAPDKLMSDICEVLSAYYDSGFMQSFQTFTHCTGDTGLSHASRGSQLDRIMPLKSYQGVVAYEQASDNENCRTADRLLGYGD